MIKNYEIEFWKDWLESKPLKRLDLVKRMNIFKICLQMEDNNMWKTTFATLLNGYFEELESAVYTKIRMEEEKLKEVRKLKN